MAAVGICFAATAEAKSKWKSKGQVTLEGRAFLDDDNSQTVDEGLGMLGRVELSHRHKPFREKARIYGRLDSRDSNRTILIVEELWAEVKLGDFRLRVGADLQNWSATEAFHPADIINARNLDSDVEDYEKLGEPMVRLSYQLGTGTISAFFFPYYTRTVFPAPSSRLSFIPPDVPTGAFLFMDANGNLTERNFGPQGAIRFTQSFRGIDIGLHVVHHLDRLQPEVLFDPQVGLPRPLFRTVTQIGGTYQHVLGPVIAKLEAGYRIFAAPDDNMTPLGEVQDRDHLQIAGGFEYGFFIGDAELTFILEGQSYFLGDEIVEAFGGEEKDINYGALRRSLGVFQQDGLFGFRLSFNGILARELRGNAVLDLQDLNQVLVNITYSQRFWTNWGLSLGLRMVFGPQNSALTGGFAVPTESDHVRLFLTRYF
ncbi:MAG: hypothetical protein AAF449_02515 [Myxococcota bacterium]